MYMIYLNLSFIFFFMFILNMFFMMKFLLLKMKFYIELNLMKFNGMNLSLMMYFDFKTFLFMSVVLLISSMIVLYSINYMKFDKFNIKFIYILMMFVISMLMMIMGQNLLMILLGWDGLGLISYCLVIYYNNWNSYNSGMVTIMMNRLGDIGLLISIGIFSMYGDWNYLLMNSLNHLIIIFMIILSCFTKSAQIPFSSWLPMAMSAPTPVSALVHSSTLVTAGIYLMIRFKSIIIMNNNLFNMVLILSLLTMFFSGMVASFENDFKKIIALSTLSQLGIMMFSLLMNLKLLSFFHLINHALFKSLLFMCAGLILHSMFNNQDIRYMGVLNMNYFSTMMMFNCSNLALCGFPFLTGFYSKDLILEMMIFKNLNYYVLFIFYLSMIFTVIYTYRLIYFMMNNFMKFYSMNNCFDNKLMNYSMFLLFILSIIGGCCLSWMVFLNLNFMFLNKFMKILMLMLIFIFIFFGNILNYFNNKKFILNMKIFNFMKSLIMMNYLNKFYIKNILMMSNKSFIFIEKGWIEIFSVKMINLFYLNFMKIESLNYLMIMKNLMLFYFLFLMFYLLQMNF